MSRPSGSSASSSARVFLVHAGAFPLILLASWAGTGSLVEILFRLPFPPDLSAPVTMAALAAVLHLVLGRITARSHADWRTLRGHLARCIPGYLVGLAGGWVAITNWGAEGFQWVAPFFGFAIAVSAGQVLGDLALILWYRRPDPGGAHSASTVSEEV